jgi:HEAT repeat protein
MTALLAAVVFAVGAVPPDLAAAARDADPSARIKALMGLVNHGVAAVPVILPLLKDEDASVRQSAAYALTRIKAEPPALLAAVAPAVADPDANARKGVLGVLGRAGPTAVPLITKLLTDSELSVRQAAVLAVQEQMKRDAPFEALRPALTVALRDKAAEVRLAAVATLARGKADAAPLLLAAMTDTDTRVRAAAVGTVVRLKPVPKEALPAVAGRLAAEKEPAVRKNLILALGGLGPDALPHLVARLQVKEPGEQLLALKALEQQGAAAAGALPVVLGLVAKPPNSAVRLGALQVLGKLPTDVPRPRGTVAVLAAALADEEADVRALAAHLLGEAGPAAREALPALKKAREAGPAAVRDVIDKAVGKITGS